MKHFILNGRQVNLEEIIKDFPETVNLTDFEYRVLSVLRDWMTGKSIFTFKTSGSTGPPKEITFTSEQIKASAMRTIRALGLKPKMTALACLNPEFIAGYMMLVRAMEGELELIATEPKSNPLILLAQNHLPIDFAAMTPGQVMRCADETPEKLNEIKVLLIGGAGLHLDLENKLEKFQGKIFHSYAMTETITHVALREINQIEKPNHYEAMEGVSFEQAEDDCLIVHDKLLDISVKTNDLVELFDDRRFCLIGRVDHVVNSGGIKIQLETLEKMISARLSELGSQANICLIGMPDKVLTNKLVLLIESNASSLDIPGMADDLKSSLPKYHDPKHIILVPKLFQTSSGKIDRLKNYDMYIHPGNNHWSL